MFKTTVSKLNQKDDTFDFLLSPKMRFVNVEELGANRIYLLAQIVIGLIVLSNCLIYHFGYHYNDNHLIGVWTNFAIHTSIILFHRYIPTRELGTIVTCLNMYALIVINTYYSGGFFANDLFFLLAIFQAVFLFSNKKIAYYFAGLSVLTVFAFIILHLTEFRDFKARDDLTPLDADLGNLISFLISGFILILIHYRGHEKIKLVLKTLQENQVEELNKQVAIKTYEIKIRSIEFEKLRKDIAMDFHDEVGNRLAALNVLSAVAKIESQSKNPDQLDKILTKLENTSKDIHQQSRDFLWSIGQTSHNLLDVFTYIRDFADNEFENHGMQLSVLQNNIDSPLNLGANKARQVILIFKEAVLNCIRHSKANNIEFKFEVLDSLLLIYLKDDGIGLDNTTLNKVLSSTKPERNKTSGKGIFGMKHRAESINTTLIVHNIEPKGFIISLEVPLY